MQTACRRCGSMLEAAAGSRTVCASCGAVTVMPTTAPPPTPRRATAPGSFSPMPEVPSPPGGLAPAVHSGPRSNSVPAILSLVFGILPFLVAAPSYAFGFGRFDDGGFVNGFGYIAGAMGIAAIVLGAIGIKQCNREPGRYKGKGMAIAGLTLGIVFTSLWVVAMIIALVFCLIYFGAYGNSTAAMASCPAVAMQAAAADPKIRRSVRVRMLLAHHPECSAFSSDVITTGGLRLCASCASFVTTATIAGYGLLLWPPSAAVAPLLLAAGALLILLPQALSALRWTSSRPRKVLVKGTMGLGAAVLFASLLTADLPVDVRLAVFAAVTALATLLVLPRRARLVDEMRAHRHDARCGAATPSA